MPFLRTPKGSKISFSPARLSALLSLVYLEAMGNQTPKYPADIQKHCIKIWSNLEEEYGKNESDEWPGSGIQRNIEKQLRENAPLEVHEAFLSMKINEFQEPKRKPLPERNWDRFESINESKKHSHLPIIDSEKIDPVWGIVTINTIAKNHGTEDLSSENLTEGFTDVGEGSSRSDNFKSNDFQKMLSEKLGMARKKTVRKAKTSETYINEVKRSEWLEFWKKLPKKTIPFHIWEAQILKTPNEQKQKTSEQWWLYWQEQIDLSLTINPQLHELRRALFEYRKRAEVFNQEWFAGFFGTDDLKLSFNALGVRAYQKKAREHLELIFKNNAFKDLINWEVIERSIDPQRDALLDWRAWQHLNESGALWDSLVGKELPQWAWMRASIAISSVSMDEAANTNFKEKNLTKNIIKLYDQISELRLIPSSAMIREAGKSEPRYFEDNSWNVRDEFSSIQEVIYSAAVDTTWTGTSASDWSEVRSKNSKVRQGRRRSTGTNDFIRTIDSHLKAQGRTGDDRPVTVELPIWHPDVEEFMCLQHESANRLQVVLLISDLFMQRLAEGADWTLLDPHVYPEVLNGVEGYIEAEKHIDERKKLNPTSHKVISSERLWKRVLTQSRLGSPFITFEGSNDAYSPLFNVNTNNKKTITGLDGVGAFPLPIQESGKERSQKLEWPVMAINLSLVISDQGEPLLDNWRETINWAFWVCERVYKTCEDSLSEETKRIRPVCIGAVGFYEAIQKAIMVSGKNLELVDNWLGKISEAWATLVTVVDQGFCQKYGPAPIWNEVNDIQTFHPHRCYDQLKSIRNGGIGMPPLNPDISDLFDKIDSHRFSVRTVWAPFKQASIWAGVSPGGFGTLFPAEWVIDEDNIWRLVPSSYLISEMERNDASEYGVIFSNPEQPNKWPLMIKRMCSPDIEEWKIRLRHASIVRPWIDQGVSITLPCGMPASQLSIVLRQAWWMGLTNIRFEDNFKKPENN